MTLAQAWAEVAGILTAAGLECVAPALDDTAPYVAPFCLVGAPTLEDGLRAADGTHRFAGALTVHAVAGPEALLGYVDRVTSALVDADLHVRTARPSTLTTGDTVNPAPAYALEVAWPHTIPRSHTP